LSSASKKTAFNPKAEGGFDSGPDLYAWDQSLKGFRILDRIYRMKQNAEKENALCILLILFILSKIRSDENTGLFGLRRLNGRDDLLDRV
jgi:hypothetical protein